MKTGQDERYDRTGKAGRKASCKICNDWLTASRRKSAGNWNGYSGPAGSEIFDNPIRYYFPPCFHRHGQRADSKGEVGMLL